MIWFAHSLPKGWLDKARRLFALALVWALLIGATPATGAAPTRSGDAIDQYVVAQMEAGSIPGVTLAIVRDDRIVSLRSYGVAGPDGRPLTPQTPMAVGSVSKPLTAMAVLQLVERGKLRLDAPLRDYLPAFRLADEPSAARITVRQLLAHTSGFSTAQGRAGLARDERDDAALERYARDLAGVRPAAAPGERWQYSNVNYSLLGLLVQTVAGVPYEQYMQEQVFAPLQMADSSAAPAILERPDMAIGSRYWFDRPLPDASPPYPRGMTPAINVVASAEDLGHLLIAQLNGGRYAGRQVLSPELIAAMQRPAADTGVAGTAYGLGLGINVVGGRRVLVHGGDTANFHSELIFSPEERWGVAVLINANTSLAPTALGPVKLLPFGVAERVAGRAVIAPAPAEGNPFWILVGGLGALLVIQAVRLIVTPRHSVRSWRLLVSLVTDGAIVWGTLVALPGLLGTPLDTILAYQPDVGWLLVLTGGLTIAGVALRLWRALERPRGVMAMALRLPSAP